MIIVIDRAVLLHRALPPGCVDLLRAQGERDLHVFKFVKGRVLRLVRCRVVEIIHVCVLVEYEFAIRVVVVIEFFIIYHDNEIEFEMVINT